MACSGSSSYLLAQEQAHVLVLTHALGRRYPPPAPEVSLDRVVTTIAVKMQSSQLRSQRGWVDLLQALTWRLQGLLYYATIPGLRGRDSLLAASILADEAEHSVQLSALRHTAAALAVPAALVRGWRLPAIWRSR